MYSTEAIILNIQNTGEFDELVSFYTRDFGKLVIKVKSSKKITTKQGNFLHNLSICHISFVSSRAGYILSGIMNISAYPAIASNLRAHGYVMGFLNLCDQIFYEGQADSDIWNLFLEILNDAEELSCVSVENQPSAYWRKEKIWLVYLLKILGVKPRDLNLESIADSRELDLYLKNILQNKFEQPIEFFGLSHSNLNLQVAHQ